jgi:probable HAF family extracellular repeat protein
MKAKVNLFRTLLVLWVVLLAVAVALFGVGPRTADTQTTPTTYYKVQALGVPPGSTVEPNSIPYDINDFGHVVGEASISGSSEGMNAIAHAFLYENGQMRDLGTLPGGTSSAALGINISGQIVGYGTYGSSSFNHAFLYRGEGPMQDLGVLSSVQNHSSWAKDINDRDQVVGYSDNDYSSTHYNRAFLYQNEEMIDLGTRLHPDKNGNIWNLDSANGINNEGQIVTEGWRKESDGITYSGLLLTPTSDIPPPPDNEAPSPPTITSPPNNSYDKDGSFSVSGSAEAASSVELFEGTTSKGTIKADSSSGAWSIALSEVSEGTHTYTAKATDAAGNTTSASNSVSVTVDKSAPKVESVVPQEDATRVAPGVDVTATFSEGMQDASVKSAFKLYKKGTTTGLTATVSYDAESRKATLNPFGTSTTLLTKGVTYKAVVSTGAKDLAGNSLDQDERLSGSQQKVWFFKVGN